jgi:hypothetical protein
VSPLLREVLVDSSTRCAASGYDEASRKFENETIDSLMSLLFGIAARVAALSLGRLELQAIIDIEAEFDLRDVKTPFKVGQKELEKIWMATPSFVELSTTRHAFRNKTV